MAKSKSYPLKPLMAVSQSQYPLDWEEIFSRKAPLNVEIGFGCGEVLIREASARQDHNFVGLELNWERIQKTLQGMCGTTGDLKIPNVRILKVDARPALEWLFATESIDSVYSLYPCPWPKKGHIKHRLFSNDFLKLLNNRLKLHGEVKIVTDFYPYIEWILGESEGTGFSLRQETIQPQYGTKFERRWTDGGQEEFYALDLIKIQHLEAPFKVPDDMQTYKIKNFKPERFQFADQTGAIAVVLKDFLFDSGREKAMVHVVVSEPETVQHFRISILKKEDGWLIRRADGQNVFPTPGLAQAIRLVYEAAAATLPSQPPIE